MRTNKRREAAVTKVKSGLLSAAVVATMITAGSAAIAETAGTNMAITQIIIDDSNFAGCLAAVVPGPETIISGCAAGFVTFDCSGELNTSGKVSSSKLASAQLAFVTNTLAFIEVDNSRTYNGYCLAKRVDNQNNPVP